MRNGIQDLTEREKETLRLLLHGHDAKSIARAQALSVHTVNERLREARRKLDVSSSREAARLLAEAEPADPNSLTDKQFGVAREAIDVRSNEQPHRRQSASPGLAWLGGGVLVMSLVIAAVVLSMSFQGSSATDEQSAQRPGAVAITASETPAAGLNSAREWVALLDEQRWEESWRAAADLFRSQLTAAQWTSSVQPVRQPLGPVSSRVFKSVTKANSLPGAPAGEYEMLQFETNFAGKRGAIETVVLTRDASGWKVTGYFIR